MNSTISTKTSTKAFSVMKALSAFTKEDMKTATELKVTYIPNKKAKIVRARRLSEVSTDEE